MEVVQVLHMNGGLGDTSYANNYLVQREVISMVKPITEKATAEVYKSMTRAAKSFCIAELGCSSEPNALFVAAIEYGLILRAQQETWPPVVEISDTVE